MKAIRELTIILGIAVVLCGSTATADLAVNGSFELGAQLVTPDPITGQVGIRELAPGWTATGADPSFLGGPVAIESEVSRDWSSPTPASDWTATEGNYFASLWSTDSMGTDYSTLSQTFTTPDPGYLLEFDYFFDFGDLNFQQGTPEMGDWAEGTLSWSGGSAVLFEHNYTGDLADEENIDWTTVSYVLPDAATYTLEFAIYDGLDMPGAFESILGVDNVSVVPAPGAFLLGVIGLGYANLRLRKRRTS
jgi:hypothetical protein